MPYTLVLLYEKIKNNKDYSRIGMVVTNFFQDTPYNATDLRCLQNPSPGSFPWDG